MGVIEKDPFLLGLDQKPKNGKQVKETKKTTVPAEAADPFLLGQDVKKKETSDTIAQPLEEVSQPPVETSSTGAESTPQSTSPLIFASEPKETIFDKSFLDRDIEKRSLLSDPSISKPANKYSLLTPYFEKRQAAYKQGIEEKKRLVKATPESLAAYTQDRVDDINKDIEFEKQRHEEKKKEAGLGSASMSYGATKGMELQNELLNSISDYEGYKKSLKQSVAAAAASKFVPAALAPGVTFDARKLGRDIVKVADPEQEKIFQEAEAGGLTVPGITKANLERIGIDLAKDYLTKQPQTDFVKGKLAEIEDLESDFDTRYFELTAQRVKEKLGVYFYEKGKSGFWGYSGKNIESAISDPLSGLTDSEKEVARSYVLPIENKLFFSTDIPGSGFFRSGKNAIERSILNTGNTVAGWMGDRTDADRAQDILGQEIEGSRFRAPGENPTWKSELSYLNLKEKRQGLSEEEKTQKVELEKYVDVRNGWSKFKDGTGDLTGQVLEIAVLTKGIGAGGRAIAAFGEGGGILGGMTSSAIGTALTNETVGLFLSSYLNAFDNYKTQAIQIMPGKENAANRDAYAKVMAGVEGLSERIFNDVKVLKGFTKEIGPAVSDITNRFINKEITQQVARQELQSALVKYAKPFGKEFFKSTYQESFEEGIVDWADGAAQSIFGGQPFDIAKTGQQSINTFLTTALHSGVVSSMSAHGAARQSKSQNAFMKSAIVDMANSPTPYLKSVEDLLYTGQITQEQANEKIKLINSASKYFKEIPESITVGKKTKEGTQIVEKQLDYPEVSTYMVHRLNEGIIQEQLDNLKDEALRPQLEQQLKRSIEIRKGIIDSSIGVTPDIQEVTDNPKKAQDLGILDSTQLQPDELIGTPFKNESEERTESDKMNIRANELYEQANSLPPEQMDKKKEMWAEADQLRIDAKKQRVEGEVQPDEISKPIELSIESKEEAQPHEEKPIITPEGVAKPLEKTSEGSIEEKRADIEKRREADLDRQFMTLKGVKYFVKRENDKWVETGETIESVNKKYDAELAELEKQPAKVSTPIERVSENVAPLTSSEREYLENLDHISNTSIGSEGSYEEISTRINNERQINYTPEEIAEVNKIYKEIPTVDKDGQDINWEKRQPLLLSVQKKVITRFLSEPHSEKTKSNEQPKQKSERVSDGGVDKASNVGVKIFHGTTAEIAKQIEDNGFDVEKGADGTMWFTSDKSRIEKGEVGASVKGGIVERTIDESNLKLGGYDEQDKYSTGELINMGYDGLKLEDADGQITYQIFEPNKVLKKIGSEQSLSKQESGAKPKANEQATPTKQQQGEKQTIEEDIVDEELEKLSKKKSDNQGGLTSDQQIIKKAIDADEIKGIQKEVAKAALENPETADQFLKEVADQALNKVASEIGDPSANAIKTYGESIVNLAKEKFPKTENIKQDEKEKTNIPAATEDKGVGSSTQVSGEEKREKPEKQEKLFQRLARIADEHEFTEPYDIALHHFAGGGQINPSAIQEVFGNQRGKSVESEKRARISLLGKNAPGIDALAHGMWQEAGYPDSPSTQDFKDAIERVLNDFNSKSAMAKDLVERYDWEAAQEKYMELQYGNEAIAMRESMTQDELNHLLSLDAEGRTEEADEYFDDITNQKSINDASKEEAARKEGGKKSSKESSEEKTDELLNETTGTEEPGAEAVPLPEKTIAEQGKALANKFRSFKSKPQGLQANVFGIPIAIYDGAMEIIATAVEKGAELAQAIQSAIKYIRKNGGDEFQEQEFTQHVEDIAAGKKPKITTTGEVGSQSGRNKTVRVVVGKDDKSKEGDVIDDYEMETSNEVGRFLSGATIENVFGEAPEGDQLYQVQKLKDMLEDGKNMIDIAQKKWGVDVMDYAKPLFEYIQRMSNDAIMTNKKAVLLATFLGELKEAMIRDPASRGQIQPIYNAVEAYYQNYMNLRGKEVVAGRLLRLYRDKYMGDIFVDRILEDQQVVRKQAIAEAEIQKRIDDALAAQAIAISAAQKEAEDKADAEAHEKDKKQKSKKKKMASQEAKDMAAKKEQDLKDRLGDDAKNKLIDKINEAIKKLNCK